MNKNNDDNNKVVNFPDTNKRKSLKKDAAQQRKSQDNMEEKYRAEYSARRAKELSNNARRSANSGKIPMINWHKIPIFTRSIIGVFIVVQIVISFVLSAPDKLQAMYSFGFVPAIYSGADEWAWSAVIAPFTSLFIHGGWMHLAFNIVMMLAMGIFFERQFGSKLTAIFFVLCGLAGSLVCVILSPESTIPIIGASGAISGLFAVSFLLMIEQGLLGADAQRRGGLSFILLWSVMIVIFGMLSNDVSWQSHIGGFLGGVGLFYLWKSKVRKV